MVSRQMRCGLNRVVKFNIIMGSTATKLELFMASKMAHRKWPRPRVIWSSLWSPDEFKCLAQLDIISGLE
jgi:hypothetical protein